ALARVLDLHAEAAPIADVGFDLITEVADTEHHATNAASPQPTELVSDERLPGDLEQRLGAGRLDRLPARPEPPGQQRPRDVGEFWRAAHDTITFAPSKSKRKRTSCRPAARRAWRSRVLSAA